MMLKEGFKSASHESEMFFISEENNVQPERSMGE